MSNPPVPLSEAIRLGGTLASQCTGALARVVRRILVSRPFVPGLEACPPPQLTSEDYETCAIGGALHAVGANIHELAMGAGGPGGWEVSRRMFEHWPSIEVVRAPCPVSDCPNSLAGREIDLQSVIIHLNDGHKWTRDQIADFVKPYDAAVAEKRELPPPQTYATIAADSAAMVKFANGSTMVFDEYTALEHEQVANGLISPDWIGVDWAKPEPQTATGAMMAFHAGALKDTAERRREARAMLEQYRFLQAAQLEYMQRMLTPIICGGSIMTSAEAEALRQLEEKELHPV